MNVADGLEIADRSNVNERRLSSKVHGADVLKKLPKLEFRSRAHGSICVQEGQPVFSARFAKAGRGPWPPVVPQKRPRRNGYK